MQVVYKNEDERGGSKRVNLVGIIVCAGEISRYLKGEHVGRFEGGVIRI